MAIVKRVYDFLFKFYVYFYILLYLGYIFLISVGHSSYSVVSIPAVVLPFILLLILIRIEWKRFETKHNSSEKKNLRNLAFIGTVPFLICLVILGVNENKTSFTTEKWVRDMSERVYLVDDLLNTYDLQGKSKKEIETLLGPPTETEYFKKENNVVYYLGDERGIISIDSEWLVIEFDAKLTVEDYAVVTD